MAQGGQSRGWKFLTITTSQCLLLVFLLLYTSIISYYLYITNEKSHLQDVIIKEKILNLQKEYQELIKMTKWIEEHPNQNHTNIIKDLHVIDQELETIERTDARKESSTSQPKFDHPHQHETITPTKSNTMIKMPPAILVVGGTDGSGTRRVVQLLTNLGVLIVSEDPETYDIHADLFGGWPKVVTPVLEAAGSIIYDTKDLPPQLQTSTETNLRRLLTQAERDSHKPESKRLAVGGALPTPPDVHASNVLYGFKAPVAMTLVPWWRKLNSHFMFLHVLRDGRDIAFSANQVFICLFSFDFFQGPVTKFYHAMYKNRPELMVYPPAVKAIQLWADWNSGIKNWAEKEMKISPQTRDSSFRYLSVHIEDLVDESRDIRYKAIKHIAEFVGSGRLNFIIHVSLF